MNVNKKGFTLIEIIIVVVILGILVTVGYPSYVEHIKKGRQAGAKTLLEAGRLSMETFYGRNGAYPAADTSFEKMPGFDYTSVKNMDPQARYKICIVNSAPTSFLLKARCNPPTCDVGDGELDFWTINQQGLIQHPSDEPSCSGPAI